MPHVYAKDGKAVEKYEKGKGDLPVSVLMGKPRFEHTSSFAGTVGKITPSGNGLPG